MKSFYFLLLLLALSRAFAQEAHEVIYIVNQECDLLTFDLEDCSYTNIGTFSSICSAGEILTDITFTPNGKLYGINAFNVLEIDTITAETTPVCTYELPAFLGYPSLTFLNDSVLLTDANNTLWAINLYDCSIDSIGPLNYAQEYIYAYATGEIIDSASASRSDGDLTWYDGDLYAVASTILNRLTLNSAGTEIISTVRVNDTSIKIPTCWGLVSIGEKQAGGAILAFGESPFLLTLDPETGVMDTLCLPWPGTGPWGAASYTRYIDTVVDATTALHPEIKENLQIMVYPNPVVNNVLYIETGNMSINGIFFYDKLGKRINVNLSNSYNDIAINLPENLPPGIYILELIFNENAVRKKIVVR
ncbi:T9SS type A sorting domain-containing protein [Pedobacter panaciterrae]|uniref:T9SS type A sorting domain-containing protein n=1 Tax=Pedobacter panaciterrae TaxID=363849 RepID=UPI0025946F63|nr:T9SS type A sorting domain-containing protein [uncultured Pedobacter sp.]